MEVLESDVQRGKIVEQTVRSNKTVSACSIRFARECPANSMYIA